MRISIVVFSRGFHDNYYGSFYGGFWVIQGSGLINVYKVLLPIKAGVFVALFSFI
jgi:hypothetical protein